MINKRSKLDLRANDRFFKNCRKKKCGGVLLYFQPNDTCFQTTVIIPKKKAAKSTLRNQVKRNVYQAIEKTFPQIKAWQLSVAVVIVNPQQVLEDERLQQNILACLEQIQQIYEKDSH